MYKYINYLALVLIISSFGYATELAKLKGVVSEAGSGEIIPGANVLIENTSYGTVTNIKGEFYLTTLPEGEYNVKISSIGYVPVIKPVIVKKGKTIEMDVVLERTVYDMDAIVVTGTRFETIAKNIPQSVSVVTTKDLEMQHAKSIDDALINTPGVFFQRSQGLGTTTSHAGIRMRGTGAANRTLIMKDGIPINSTNSGGVALWSTIGVNGIDKIEIVRGAGSALYGSNAMGGVVNMISASPSPRLGIKGHAEFGTFGTSSVGLKVSKAFNKFGFVVNGEHKRFDGYEYMKDDVWKEYYIKPQNEFTNINTKLEYKFTPTSVLDFSVEHHSEQPEKGTSTKYDMDSKQNRYSLRYNNYSDILSYSGSLYYSNRDYSSVATKYDKTTGSHTKPYYESDIPETQLGFIGYVTVKLPQSLGKNVNQKVTFGVDGKHSENESTYNYTSGKRFYEGVQNLYSVFVNDEIAIGKSLNLSIGLRYDWWNTEKGSFFDNTKKTDVVIDYPTGTKSRFSPKVGLVYHINDDARLRANYGTGFKAPGLFYMYRSAPKGSTKFMIGNPDLEPEVMNMSLDIGADIKFFNKLEANVTYFQSNFEDFIYSKTLSESEIPSFYTPSEGITVVQYTNLGEVAIKGIEASLNYNISRYFSAFVNFTHSKSEIKKHNENSELEGKKLEDNPDTFFNLGIKYNNPKILSVALWLRHTGSQFSDAMNTNEVDGYEIVDLKVQREIYSGISLSMSVYNLFDKEYYSYYSSAKSYSLGVPRTLLFGISYEY